MGEDSEDWFKALNEQVSLCHQLRDDSNMTAFLVQAEHLFDMIRRGSQKYQKRRELMNWIDLRQKVSVAETRRLEKEHQMLTREQVLLLMNAMGRIVYEEVKDRQVRARIAERVAQLTA